ncbi:RNA polymerase sigma factor, sigma-70 family [Sinosporangium album]|uniref:RNA polymerase sigma factor, sigma-70 family n=1 Tax=Sinosporangium album TaxID=504805 RepID=A0A1G8GB92_9ACTN|nr:sigma-70 family RNA polymerase sigma factor [Sinosporangium album]SDH91659.1 RNA polymerase sigma factor, sigma-70 family [Sinosporangium album]
MDGEILRLAERAPSAPAPPTAYSDTELVDFYREQRLNLVRLAVLLVGDGETAEDIVQDVFIRLHKVWRPQVTTLAYVRTAVLNAARSVLRRRAMMLRRTAWAADWVDSAESTALVGEARREVLAALGRLPRRQRETLVLRYYLDLPDAEIAEIMRVGQSTVRSTAARALGRLSRELGETI